MATIQRRAGRDGKTSYRVQVRLRGFAAETASFERLTDAKAWASKTESDMKAGRHFGQSKRHTFNELADEYLENAAELRSYAQRKRHIEHWRKVFGPDLLDAVTPARIAKERSKLLSEETNRFAIPPTGDPDRDAKRPRSKRTGPAVNRYHAALSACLAGTRSVWGDFLGRSEPVDRIRGAVFRDFDADVGLPARGSESSACTQRRFGLDRPFCGAPQNARYVPVIVLCPRHQGS